VRQLFSSDADGSFEASIQLLDSDARLRSGLSAQLVFVGVSRRNVLFLPRQALFLKDGKRIVYVKNGSGYEQRQVKIESQNESRAAIEGLSEGDKIALVDPTSPRKAASDSATTGNMEGTP
jgi:multidrug efflux pump subunit AcrA (membrane-fusion protein)